MFGASLRGESLCSSFSPCNLHSLIYAAGLIRTLHGLIVATTFIMRAVQVTLNVFLAVIWTPQTI
jgi:hypothetical protein